MNTSPAAQPRHRLLRYAALLALALGTLAWRVWPDGTLRVIFLETPGDAVLMQTPAGGYVLIDGGSDPAALAAALGKHMPFWQRTLDAVVLTGAGSERLPGQVAALGRYHARLAIAGPASSRSPLMAEWQRLLRADSTPIHIAQAGQRFAFGGAQLRVLAIGEGKEGGMLLRLEYGSTSAVLDQNALAGAVGQRAADMLAFPWEYDPRNDAVAAMHPRAIIFTDGASAPDPAELSFRDRAVGGAQLFHERLNGTITWASNGRRATVTSAR